MHVDNMIESPDTIEAIIYKCWDDGACTFDWELYERLCEELDLKDEGYI